MHSDIGKSWISNGSYLKRKILKVKGIVNKDKGIFASCVWGSQADSVYTGSSYPRWQCLQCPSGESMSKFFTWTFSTFYTLAHTHTHHTESLHVHFNVHWKRSLNKVPSSGEPTSGHGYPAHVVWFLITSGRYNSTVLISCLWSHFVVMSAMEWL